MKIKNVNHADIKINTELTAPGKKIRIVHKETQRHQNIFFGAVAVLFILALFFIEVDYNGILQGFDRLPSVIKELSQISFENFGTLAFGMLTTLTIAFLAVLISLIISFPISFIVAYNVTPNKFIGTIFRYATMLIRSIPTPIWVLIAVASLGFGPMAGIIGLLFPTTSFFVKAFAAQIEEEGSDVIEAIRSVGGTWWHVVIKGLLPVLFTGLIATIGVRFELDVHESVILGIVGAGGIGYLLQSYIQYYQFGDLTLGILMVFVTIFTLELVINLIRLRIGDR